MLLRPFRTTTTQFHHLSNLSGPSPALFSLSIRNFSSERSKEEAKKLLHDEETKQTIKKTQIFLEHPIWSAPYLDALKRTHKEPSSNQDRLAWWTIRIMRFNFDWMSGYMFGEMTEQKWLRRIIFLETVAGVPGSIAGVLRHLEALRLMRQDNGWIYTFLGEAENESMHLQTMIGLYRPGLFFRTVVFLTQGVFFNFFFAAYLLSPKFCHRMVGYLEEEAVITYTHLLEMLDQKKLKDWADLQAPQVAIDYWKLDQNANWRDVIAVIRADEAHHRTVNHTFADLLDHDKNPSPPEFEDLQHQRDLQLMSQVKRAASAAAGAKAEIAVLTAIEEQNNASKDQPTKQ